MNLEACTTFVSRFLSVFYSAEQFCGKAEHITLIQSSSAWICRRLKRLLFSSRLKLRNRRKYPQVFYVYSYKVNSAEEVALRFWTCTQNKVWCGAIDWLALLLGVWQLCGGGLPKRLSWLIGNGEPKKLGLQKSLQPKKLRRNSWREKPGPGMRQFLLTMTA